MEINLVNVAIGHSANTVLVSQINLKARAGDLIVVVGDNGIGKTTLLKTISGILPAIKGDVYTIPKEQIGFAGSDTPPLLPNMTGEEIIRFFEEINSSKMPQAAYHLTLFEAIQKKQIHEMSSGMKQILKLLITSLERKDLILWDEPLRGLAETAKMEIIKFAKDISRKKIMFIAEHSFHEWRDVSTQMFLINNQKGIESCKHSLS